MRWGEREGKEGKREDGRVEGWMMKLRACAWASRCPSLAIQLSPSNLRPPTPSYPPTPVHAPPTHPPSRAPLILPQIKRTVKLITRQRPISEPSPMEGFPMRSWSIEVWLVDDKGNEVVANCFEKAVYNLHPSFEKNKQSTYTILSTIGLKEGRRWERKRRGRGRHEDVC